MTDRQQTDRQTDGQTDGQIDARGKTICLPTLKGGDIMTNDSLMKVESFNLHLAIIGLEKQFLVFLRVFILDRFYCISKPCFKETIL